MAASGAAPRAVLLSGTPSLSRPYDLFRQVDVLQPGILGRTKEDFAHRWEHKVTLAAASLFLLLAWWGRKAGSDVMSAEPIVCRCMWTCPAARQPFTQIEEAACLTLLCPAQVL